MKKLFALLIAAVLVFGIAACDKTQEPTCAAGESLIDGVCVAPNQNPTFSGLTDVTLFVGDTFDALSGVTASDPEDGNITSSIQVLSQPNMMAAGSYEVTYSVTDSDGATVVGTRTVTVEVPNQAPVFTGVSAVSVQQNVQFDPLFGVTATDPEDGDLTAAIRVTGTVVVSTVGTYTITYSVTDSDGLQTEVDRVVTITEGPVDNPAEINGANPLTIALDTNFTALKALVGVSSTDFEDGDLTSAVTVDLSALDTSVAGVYTITYSVTDSGGNVTTVDRTVTVNTLPEIFVGTVADGVATKTGEVPTSSTVATDGTIDLAAGIVANDAEDGPVTVYVDGQIAKDVDGNYLAGNYVITYLAYDADGGVASVNRTIVVSATGYVYPSGFYNYKFATPEIRNTFMAAAERYLLETMAGGIPVFANGGLTMYSDRVVLPTESYVAVMGYGAVYGQMSADDSTVVMDNGQPGNEGEYTYRTAVTTNPTTFNQWLSDDSNTSTVMGDYLDALYVYHYNADKTGYEVVPSMAGAEPIAVGDDTITNEAGKVISDTWQVPIRDGLEWYVSDEFKTAHPEIDTTDWDMDITAQDFLDTFKLALDKNWFRAISGGGDFLSSSQEIKGAQAYVDGTGDWADVGIKIVDGNLQFTFVNDMSTWNVKYWLSDFTMGPIQMDMYQALGGNLDRLDNVDADGNSTSVVGTYGTDADSIAYSGAYYVSYYEPDKIVRLVANPVYHDPTEYFYTGRSYVIINDAALRFQEFINNKLDVVGVPTENVDDYANDLRVKRVPGAVTFRIMINGLGTEEAQKAKFPDSDWTPEPLLANQNFKLAMYFAVDRQKLAEEVLKSSTTQMYHFSDAYLVDAETGVPFRNTPQGISVGEGFSPETNGYNPDAAQKYFEFAIQELVDAGVYQPGASVNDMNEINIELNIFSGSQAQVLFGNYIKTAFESVFIDTTNNIKVTITPVPKDFPSIYYDYMMVGNFDLSIGGISGSTLDAASFLDVYADDDRGGFTLNWGIDTHTANVKVDYTNEDGEAVNEMWSFNAITSVLNGEVFIDHGEEATIPTAQDFEFTPTTATFTLDQFNNPAFTNFSYTVQYYSLVNDYTDVADMVNIPITTAVTTVTGLHPGADFGTYGSDAEYVGDYQIVIHFEYAGQVNDDGTPKTGSYIAPWFFMPEVITVNSNTPSATGAVLDITLDDSDYARSVVSVDVLPYTALGDPVAGATVDFTDLSNIVVGGLASATDYVLVFTFDDGNTGLVWVTTN